MLCAAHTVIFTPRPARPQQGRVLIFRPAAGKAADTGMKPLNGNDLLIENAKHIHMIGIGGSGMFPLAEILHEKGYHLTGSDNNETDTLARVRSLGIEVHLGHAAENINGADLVIHSAAIMQDNPELEAARRQGIPTLERSYLLGYVTRKYDGVIGVCGTHGKTTTTSMITHTLLGAGLDPAAVIGGKLSSIGGSGRVGGGDIMVCESCEFHDTFLRLSPDIAVILNIDSDHMEYFKTIDNLIASFHKFASMARTVIVNADDERSMTAVKGISSDTVTFGETDAADFCIRNVAEGERAAYSFDLYREGSLLTHIRLRVPGRHNVANAAAAAAACTLAGASPEQISAGLADFGGAGRRFEILGTYGGVTVADDYAHHPAELRVTLSAALKMGYRRIIAVFQPFTFSRTAYLLDDFAEVLSMADQAVLSEIMGSREVNTFNIHTSQLCEKIPGAVWFKTFDEIADYTAGAARPGDLVITLGCGDIYKAARLIIKRLSAQGE